MAKQLLLIRHAHRDVGDGRHLDNGLSAKGEAQAKQIVEHWRSRLERASVEVHSSPKLRCQQTVMPLAKELGVPCQITLGYDEQEEGRESMREFEKRVGRALEAAESAPTEWVVGCSHGDWIPSALDLLLNAPLHLRKGRWVHLELGDKPKIIEFYE